MNDRTYDPILAPLNPADARHADQMERLIAVLERIADRLDADSERDNYQAALIRWKNGSGRHPDD